MVDLETTALVMDVAGIQSEEGVLSPVGAPLTVDIVELEDRTAVEAVAVLAEDAKFERFVMNPLTPAVAIPAEKVFGWWQVAQQPRKRSPALEDQILRVEALFLQYIS